MQLDVETTLPTDSTAGTLVGRVWRPELGGSSVVAIRPDGVFDISRSFATMPEPEVTTRIWSQLCVCQPVVQPWLKLTTLQL